MQKSQNPACIALVRLYFCSELCSILLGVKLLKLDCLALGVVVRRGHFVSTSVLHDSPLQPGDPGETLFSWVLLVGGWCPPVGNESLIYFQLRSQHTPRFCFWRNGTNI